MVEQIEQKASLSPYPKIFLGNEKFCNIYLNLYSDTVYLCNFNSQGRVKAYIVHLKVLINIKCVAKTYSNRFPYHLLLFTMGLRCTLSGTVEREMLKSDVKP